MDSRTVYIGHKEPPPGAEAYIPQRYPDNRIVSSKVREPQPMSQCRNIVFIVLFFCFTFRQPCNLVAVFLRMTRFTLFVFGKAVHHHFSCQKDIDDDCHCFPFCFCVCDNNSAVTLSHSIPSGTSFPRICLSSSEESLTSTSWSYF